MLTFLAALSAIVGAQTIDAPITAVTVWSDRARVTRTASLSLAGERRVELPLLPDTVDGDSVRVEASGGEVRRVDIARVAAADYPRDEAGALLDKLEQLGDKLAQAQEERGAAAAMIGALGRLAPSAPADPMRPPPKLNAAGWAAAAAFVDAWSDKLRARVRDADEKLLDLRREQERLVAEARRLGGARRRSGLRVGVVVAGRGAARVSVAYIVTGARWYPTYDLQLQPDKGQVEVKFAGEVSQETGEDWVDAALTLSTAVPATSAVAPELLTWKIGERERFIPRPTPLPGGNANIFVGADPAGVARLKLVSPGEPFTLPLGIDRAVRPTRNVSLVTTEKGLLMKDEINQYEVTTEIANPYRGPLSLHVIDQYPLAGNKDADIKLVRTEPAPSAHEPLRGELSWKLTVPPSAKATIKFVYTIKRPKGWRLHH